MNLPTADVGVNSSTDALERFVGRVRGLYSLPAVAVKVLELTAQPQVDLRALKSCIENDPALATKVLRVVNSSLFGLTCEVRDLNQALALLGIKPLKLLVLGFSLSEALCSPGQNAAVDRYWRHTLTQAVAAREISERIWKLPGDEAFLAALLRDVGILVLLQELGEPYARLLERAAEADRDSAALEASVLGFDHRELGSRLLDLWNLPGTMVAAINLSLHPAAVEYLSPSAQALPRMLRLAQLMADLVVDHRRPALDRLYHEPAAHSPLSAGQVQELAETLQAKVEQLAHVFAFELPPGVDYRDVLIEAHSQMSRVADEMAGDWLSSAVAAESFPLEAGLLKETQALAAAAARYIAADASPPGRSGSATSQGAASAAGTSAQATADRSASAPAALGRLRSAGEPVGMPAVRSATAELVDRLQAALAECRQQRTELSLVLIEIDHFDRLPRAVGLQAGDALVPELGRLCQACDVPQSSFLSLATACYALVLPGCDRGEAVRQGDRLLIEFRQYVERQSNPQIAGLSVSVGVATAAAPAKNFRVDELIGAASRCLAAAQHSGNAVKSIGIY